MFVVTGERGVGELPLERLEGAAVLVGGAFDGEMCRWLELVAEFDRREGYASWGVVSTAG